ncbi:MULTISPECIES: hypothetical protein [unclassified Ruminococcus]|uniref:hypothetical protein n=1 Tax=unclassified Ruminococcus TaxID=2608920 RepID=UPI0021097A07|nr:MULTISPECIES: hypothetical protein [unclassified Ruminococcus]MCQ4021497.1 hypothetical protein [Ruminococcus sp. zg-924]MCQ4113942.1 hypothetical protein [Ruminococcus sp. zg-921]
MDYENQEADDFCIDIVGVTDLSKEEYNQLFGDIEDISEDVETEVKIFNKLLKNTLIDVTVKFTDGTTQTQTVVIGCEAKPYSDAPKSGIAQCIMFSLAQDEN